jgi:hypothetical protein
MDARIIHREMYGKYSRFQLQTMRTRFNAIEYFVMDANKPDKNGYSTVAFQTSDREAAIRFMDKEGSND